MSKMFDNSLKPCPFCGGFVEKKTGVTDLRMFHCVKCDAVISFLHHERDPAATACYNNRPKQTIVRCEDCKYSETRKLKVTNWSGVLETRNIRFCKYGTPTLLVPDIHFCSYGEWKDDDSHPFADDVMMGEWKDDE